MTDMIETMTAANAAYDAADAAHTAAIERAHDRRVRDAAFDADAAYEAADAAYAEAYAIAARRQGFTVQSWNNANPETFPNFSEALHVATFRAGVDGRLVKVIDHLTDEQAEVHGDGHVGKWL